MTVLFDPAWQLGVGVNRANCELAVEAGGEQQGLGVTAQPSAVGVSCNLGAERALPYPSLHEGTSPHLNSWACSAYIGNIWIL